MTRLLLLPSPLYTFQVSDTRLLNCVLLIKLQFISEKTAGWSWAYSLVVERLPTLAEVSD